MLEGLTHRLVPKDVMSGVQDNMAGGGGVGQANGELFAVHILTDCVASSIFFPKIRSISPFSSAMIRVWLSGMTLTVIF